MTWGNIFLKLTLSRAGEIAGESVAANYAGLIEVGELKFGLGISPEAAGTEEDEGVVDSVPDFVSAREAIAAKLGATVRSGPSTRLAGRSVTRSTLRDVTFTKKFDVASPALLRALNTQEQITRAVFTVIRRGETEKGVGVPLLTVDLKAAYVKSVDLKTAPFGGGMAVTEDVALRYRQVYIDYFAGQGRNLSMHFDHRKG